MSPSPASATALQGVEYYRNAEPEVFIASNPEWAQKFADAGVPIVEDDIKSQVGSTIVHRILSRLFEDRGVALDRTYQLNFGSRTASGRTSASRVATSATCR